MNRRRTAYRQHGSCDHGLPERYVAHEAREPRTLVRRLEDPPLEAPMQRPLMDEDAVLLLEHLPHLVDRDAGRL